MTTITARTVNELYRHHLLQLALTFHGGMQAAVVSGALASVLRA